MLRFWSSFDAYAMLRGLVANQVVDLSGLLS
jgi:hypothetical protein